jgi:cAMP-dependent protein kinase regulator
MSRIEELRKEADELLRAWARGGRPTRSRQLGLAMSKLAELDRIDADEGLWARRMAEIYGELGDREEQLTALGRAVDRFARSGALLRALAAAKQMMDLAMDDPRTASALRVVSSPHVRGIPTLPPSDSEPSGTWKALPLDAKLNAVSLIELAPKSKDKSLLEHWNLQGKEVEPIVLEGSQIQVEGAHPMTPLFSALDETGFNRMLEQLRLVILPEGATLFREGDPGRSLYVIAEGSVRVIVDRPKPAEIAKLDAGEFFGEIALLTERPRTATIQAASDTQLLEIDQRAISALLLADPNAMNVLLWFLRDRLVELLVRTHPIFSQLSHAEGRKLAASFTLLEAKDGTVIIEQGQKSRGLFIVLAGRADVVRDFGGDGTQVAALGPGDICGEMSLLLGEPAVAQVIARGRFIALELPASRFAEIAGAHPRIGAYLEATAEEHRKRFVEMLNEGRVDLI